jgi:glycosyltransferase involved in cell wall biosynthesis
MISVIIPCHNQAHFLPDAIGSVLTQTYGSYEIIVIDDGSCDGTSDVAACYPTRCVTQKQQGLASARNAGIRESRGEYVVFLDADDRLLPNHFETRLKAFERRPDAGLVYGGYRFIGVDQKGFVHHCVQTVDQYAGLLRVNFIGAVHTVMFKRSALIAAGAFRRDLRACEDYDLYFRIARLYDLYCHHEVVAEYRRHHQQMSQEWGRMLRAAVSVLHNQRPFIRGKQEHQDAYKDGLKLFRSIYGEPLIAQLMTNVRAHRWMPAWQDVTLLIRYHPRGIPSHVMQRFRRTVRRVKQYVLGAGHRAPAG